MRLLAAAFLLVGVAATVLAVSQLGRSLLARPDPLGPHAARGVCAAVAVAMYLVPVPLVSRACASFDAGLLAFAATAIAGLALASRLPVRSATVTAPPPRAAILFIAGLYGFLAWRYQIHDEHALFGHKNMVEQLRHGSSPIHLAPMPTEEARYHIGFDLLAGALTRAFDFGSDLSIDLVTVGLALLISLLAAAVVEEMGAPKAAPFAAVAIHLGAGLAFALLAGTAGRHPRCLIQYHHPSCGVELFPTPLLNVFQHPVSAGVPLWLAMTIVAGRTIRSDRSNRGVYVTMLVALLTSSAIAQFVYAVIGALAIALAALVCVLLEKSERRRAMVGSGLVASALIVSAALARASGGMLAPSLIIDPNAVVRRVQLGFPEGVGLSGILFHHSVNLGIGFVTLPIIAVAILRRRGFVGLSLLGFACGGIVVPHVFMYTRSWDIVKFPSASAFALTLLVVAVLDAPLIARGLPLSLARRALRLSLLGSGVAAAVFLVFPLRGELKLYDTHPFRPDPLVERSIDEIWAAGYSPKRLVLAQSNVAQQLAVFGGLAVAATDYDFEALGVRAAVLSKRRSLIERAKQSLDRATLEELDVQFLVFSEEEIENLGSIAKKRLRSNDPELELLATLPASAPNRVRHVWRVKR
ncbi:MAG: hypothetical protein HY791_33995 [Deltaproteobacteria bacterium]|nr:hypothetical protein [Deltaproteobacteria bacterium]